VTFSPTGAAATSTLTIQAVNVTNGGSGYSSAPSVSISGGGTGATATSTINVTTYTVTAAGTNYTSAPSVTITDSTGSGSGATATATMKVSNLTVGSGGSGYTSAPSISFTGGGGTGATATGTLNITAVNVTTPGSGYTSPPTVSFSGGGSGATATSTINVSAIAVTYGGGGYSSPPTVTISDTGSGTGAAATATLNPGWMMSAGTPTTTASVSPTAQMQASPITEIFTNANTDLLFYGYGSVVNQVGELAAQDVTNGSISGIPPVPEPPALGGTSAIVVDNVSTQSQASNIYFSTLASVQDQLTISTATRSGTTATITTASDHDFSVGESVTISGSVSPFNGTYSVVSVPNSTTFTITVSNSGSTSSSGGTVRSAGAYYHAIKLTQTGLQ
jgi:hypothetical protein